MVSVKLQQPGVVSCATIMAALVLVAAIAVEAWVFLVNRQTENDTALLGVFLFLLINFQIFFLRALFDRKRIAWTIQNIVSTIGLLIVAPVGTIAHALILYYWNRPETRDWFAVKR